jgi:uncharacterized OB-fold protein
VTRVPPVPGPDDRFFWEGIERGELLLQHCSDCGRLRHPPRPRCPKCGSLRRETRTAAGTGQVYSYIVPRHPPPSEGEDPLIVVLVELDEGVRLVSNLRDVGLDDIHNDMRVEIFFDEVEPGLRLPQFRPAQFRPASP